MHSTIISHLAVLTALAASAWAAPPDQSTTPALQSFLTIKDLDVSQAAQVSKNFAADTVSYYADLMSQTAWQPAYSVIATAAPAAAQAVAAANPELYLASLAKADNDDLPSWYTAMPTEVQDFWKSVGSQDIKMYTSEVFAARPIPSSVSASLSSVSASLSSAAAAATTSSTKNSATPLSPASSGQMAVVAAGVVIAAGLVGMAML
ncbi:MAG: hypothetical protein Q9220_003154 [cf. Caloplaca sp. 1 TL-2023]